MVKREGSMNGEERNKDLTTSSMSSSKAEKADSTTQDSTLLGACPLATSAFSKLGRMVKAHTDNLDKSISEVEASPTTAFETDTGGKDDDQLSSSLRKQPKKYERRRYTDSRHHTTELPDMSLEVAKEVSVRNPPVRTKKVKPSDRPPPGYFK